MHACRSNSHFFSFWLFSFFLSHLFLFYFLVSLFKLLFLSYIPLLLCFLFTARFSFYSACRDRILLFYPLTSFVWFGCTSRPPLVCLCATPITRQRRVFCLFVYRGTLSCYGLGSFSLPIPHGMHLVVPTQLASFG